MCGGGGGSRGGGGSVGEGGFNYDTLSNSKINYCSVSQTTKYAVIF